MIGLRRSRVLPVVLALALVAGGCGGPQPKLTFGGKAVPVNVSFGKPGEDDPRSNQPFVLAPVLGGVGVIPVAEERPTTKITQPAPPPPPPPLVFCPQADPTDPADLPKAEAGRDFAGAPKLGLLPTRIEGKYTVNDKVEQFKETIQRFVFSSNTEANGTIRFGVFTQARGVSATSSYVSTQAADRVPGSFGLDSIQTEGRGIDGRPSFRSPKPLTLMQMRPTPGLTWTDATTDPLSGAAFTVSGKVIGKSRIDACGQLVDAWQVALTQTVVTPLQRIDSEITYWVATQYGGLIVQESVSWRGTAGTDTVSGDYVATVNKDPGA